MTSSFSIKTWGFDILKASGWFLVIFSGILFILLNQTSVFATNGCLQTDPECGSNPTDNCDVRQNTTFDRDVYNLTNGIDICANNIVLDCNGSILIGNGTFFYATQVYNLPNGITLNNITGATIKNCNISNYLDQIGEADFFTVFASLNNGPFNQLIITANKNVTITGTTNTTYAFICIAKDTAGNTEVQPPTPEASTHVSGNNRPILGFIGDQQVSEGQTLIIQLETFDFDNQALTFDTNADSILPKPKSQRKQTLSFNKTTGLFSFTPERKDAGVYNITFNVTDDQIFDNVATEHITITVLNTLRPLKLF